MRMTLGCIAALAVGIAVAVSLRSVHYSWFETILVSFFCGAPVFLLGALWAGRRVIPNA